MSAPVVKDLSRFQPVILSVGGDRVNCIEALFFLDFFFSFVPKFVHRVSVHTSIIFLVNASPLKPFRPLQVKRSHDH